MKLFALIRPVTSFFHYRQRFQAMPGFMAFYEEENRKHTLLAMRMLCTTGAVCYLGCGVVDILLYPQVAPLLLSIRAFFAVWAFAATAVSTTSWGQRNIFSVLFASAMVADIGISIMSSQVGGWTSSYFVGNMMVTAVVTMFIPWSPRTSILYCLISVTGYVGINLLVYPPSVSMVLPVVFLTVHGALSVTASVANEIGRMKALASRLEVIKAHEELKRLDEAKARFFSNISHELRTPLSLILGPLSGLAKRGGVVSQDVLTSMTSNGRRLMRQVNALLDLGKVDSREMRCNLEPGNLGEVIEDLVRAAIPGASERGIQLESVLPLNMPDSLFDLEKVETIVANLVANAIKFTPAGGRISVTAELKPDNLFLLSVKDNGAGIPEAEQRKIFDRFHQVDNSSTRASKGTGLGLAVAREFTQLHGGRIWVDSKEGIGSRFYVELPFLEAAGRASWSADSDRHEARSTLLVDLEANEASEFDDVDIPAVNAERVRARLPEKPVVLFIDDNLGMRKYVEGVLGADYTVLLAQDGQQGLEESLKYFPDLIVSDVMMPRLNGFELLKAVRREVKLKSIPFVLLTADSSLDSRLEGLGIGADDYLSKPFSEKELLARIGNLVSLRLQTEALRKSEQKLREAHENLERRVEERTMQLAESLERERFAKIVAQNASQARLQFLTNMSHEIRTPMNSILGFSELLDEPGVLKGEHKDFLQRLRKNGSSLLHLIDDILDLSRFEAGEIPVHESSFSPRRLIDEVRQSFHASLLEKRLDLRMTFDDGIPDQVSSDGPRVRQILTNLIGNSVKFSTGGSIRVHVCALNLKRGAGTLRVDVQDDGAGISAESQRTLFQPFSQGDMTLNRRYGGSGLGLALSQRIALALGGRLELANSEVGKGSHFFFEVPFGRADVPAGDPEVSRAAAVPPIFAGKSILLAEDSADNAYLIARYLSAAGASVDTAEDGARAVEMASARSYDCVLMDIEMPVLNGLEATKQLRAAGYRGPIVALTAHALPSEVERSHQAGCNFHLTKPVNRDDLVRVLAAQMVGRSGGVAVAMRDGPSL